MVKLKRMYEYNCFESQKDLDDVKGVNLQNIPDKKGRDLHNAIIKKDINLIKKILKKNPDLDLEKDPISDDSFIELAIFEGSEDIIQLLLDFGVDPNLRRSGTYLIMEVIPLEKALDLAKILLDHGADPNVKSWSGKTPLRLAQMFEDSSLINLLKKYGAKE